MLVMTRNASVFSQLVKVLVPGGERAGGGHQVEDSDHGHLTEISSRTCKETHTKYQTLIRGEGLVRQVNIIVFKQAPVNHPTLDYKVDSLPLSLHPDTPIRGVDVSEGPPTTHDGENVT